MESKHLRSDLLKLKSDFDKLVDPVKQLFDKTVTEESLNREWHTSTRSIKCPCKTRASARAKTFVDRLRDSWQHLLRDRATRSLTYNDEQFHALEKIKVSETGKKIKSLLNEEVKPAVAMIAECVADWYKMGQANYVQTQILEKDVSVFEDTLFDIRERLTFIKENLKNETDVQKVFFLIVFFKVFFNFFLFLIEKRHIKYQRNIKLSWNEN